MKGCTSRAPLVEYALEECFATWTSCSFVIFALPEKHHSVVLFTLLLKRRRYRSCLATTLKSRMASEIETLDFSPFGNKALASRASPGLEGSVATCGGYISRVPFISKRHINEFSNSLLAAHLSTRVVHMKAY